MSCPGCYLTLLFRKSSLTGSTHGHHQSHPFHLDHSSGELVSCLSFSLLDLIRVMESTTCSHFPTWGSWGCWWSSRRGKHWLWWRAKWENWSTTKLQVKHFTSWSQSVSLHTYKSDLLFNECSETFRFKTTTSCPDFSDLIFSFLFFQESWLTPFLLLQRRVISEPWAENSTWWIFIIFTEYAQGFLFEYHDENALCVIIYCVKVPKSDEEYDLRVPRDMAYIFSGAYVPLSCRLIEQVSKLLIPRDPTLCCWQTCFNIIPDVVICRCWSETVGRGLKKSPGC